MKSLYSFCWDCGRNGKIEGLFIVDPQEIFDAVGEYITFGDVLGKHSDVSGTLEFTDFKLETSDQDFIEKLEWTMGRKNICGYNPLDYIEEEGVDE